jgi:hypothetical protein
VSGTLQEQVSRNLLLERSRTLQEQVSRNLLLECSRSSLFVLFMKSRKSRKK